MMPTKVMKFAADYCRGTIFRNCAACRNYRETETCVLVIGKIEPTGQCDLFEPRPVRFGDDQ